MSLPVYGGESRYLRGRFRVLEVGKPKVGQRAGSRRTRLQASEVGHVRANLLGLYQRTPRPRFSRSYETKGDLERACDVASDLLSSGNGSRTRDGIQRKVTLPKKIKKRMGRR